ncbi:hypothetical protein ALMP_01950 [Streptomyces sp. A012304]|nr:hypothetical protein ALMP_01950 [Streptomyces sp. A012304]
MLDGLLGVVGGVAPRPTAAALHRDRQATSLLLTGARRVPAVPLPKGAGDGRVPRQALEVEEARGPGGRDARDRPRRNRTP